MTEAMASRGGLPPGRYRPYPEHKDSGVEWLGEIPAHWDAMRAKFVAKVNPSRASLPVVHDDLPVSFHAMEAVGNGELLHGLEKPISDIGGGYTSFMDGDVLIAKITPSFENGKGALAHGLINGIGFGTTELHVIRPGPRSDPRYTFYVTLSHSFRHPGTGMMQGTAGQQRVPDDFVINFRFPLPPLSEQRAIAAFLDRETARIDALVAKKERLIELLEEKRTALISHAVTKGVDPSAPMRDSGIEWLGETPAHWEVRRWRYSCRITEGQVDPEDERYSDWILIAPNHIESGTGKVSSTETAWQQGAISGKYLVRAGDLIYSKIRPALNKVCMAEADCLCSADMYPIKVIDPDLSSRFLLYFMLSGPFVRLMVDESMRVAMPKVNRETLGGTIVLVPPLPEQQVVVELLDREAARIDALVAKVREGIERLKEYRTALISAAVTGKIDVRPSVPNPR